MTTTRREKYHVADVLLGHVLDEMIGEGRINRITANQIQSRLHEKIDEHLASMTKK
jgi:hypothetical protein